jgi:hypothetical protein
VSAGNGATANETAADKVPAVALDLDTLEREGERPGPFTFQHEGIVFQMMDPQDVDWQDLLSGLRNPALFIRYAMSLDDQKRFFGLRVPGWKMNKLMMSYQEHYSIPDLGNANALLT